MRNIKIVVRLKFNLWLDAYDGVFDCKIASSRYGKHSVATAWDTINKEEVRLELFFVDFWSEKSLSIYSIGFKETALSLSALNFVDVWIEKL
jgi:hypothetical protein